MNNYIVGDLLLENETVYAGWGSCESSLGPLLITESCSVADNQFATNTTVGYTTETCDNKYYRAQCLENPVSVCPALGIVLAEKVESLNSGNVRCYYPLSEMLQNNLRSQASILSYYEQFVQGSSFAETNYDRLKELVFSEVCFKVSNQCRQDTVFRASNTRNGAMPLCSTIHSTTPLGSLCNAWYSNHMDGVMERNIQNFCIASIGTHPQSVGCQGDTVCEETCACLKYCRRQLPTSDNESPANCDCDDPDTFTVPDSFSCEAYDQVPADCQCVNRFSEPFYNELRDTINVVYPDGCWYTPCDNRSQQLMPNTIFQQTQVCPTVICNSVSRVVLDLEDSTGETNVNIEQYVNCNISSTETTLSADALYFQQVYSSLQFTIIILIVFVFLFFFAILIFY